jgi:hypothetical protein
MKRIRLVLAFFVVATIAVAPLRASEEAVERVESGVAAYFDGRFGPAVVELKSALGALGAEADAEIRARAAYFAGRSLRELGLRGLAFHYLGQAERAGKETPSPWRSLAQREMVRAYFEAAEYSAVSQLYWRIDPASQRGEPAYLAGIALAMEGRWNEAEKVLGEVPSGDPLEPYAEFARAQSRAADLREAAARLSRIEAREAALPAGLADQARILRGKILYLLDEKAEGRAAFAAVRGGGEAGMEAVRGLLLTGADSKAASLVEVDESRPTAAATGMLVRARTADESGDVEGARLVRGELRRLVQERRRGLDVLLGGGSGTTVLRADLSAFAGRLRRERWRVRAAAERGSLRGETPAPALLAAPEPFAPREGTFYEVWNRARSDAWLRGLVELGSQVDELERDLAKGPEGPGWRFWKGDDEERFGLSLFAVRLSNLRQLLDDHVFTFERRSKEETARRKSAALEEALDAVRRLHLGDATASPEALENLRLRLHYKRADIMRLTAAVPERSTSPASSLFGNYVDLLAEMRRGLAANEVEVPELERERAAFVERVVRGVRELQGELRGELDGAMEPELRRQMAFFIRLDADNEGSLSRLYARGTSGDERGATP